MKQQISVDIGPDGTVKVEAAGVNGQGSAALTRAIEAAIGRTIGDVKKPEWHQTAKAHEHAQAKSG